MSTEANITTADGFFRAEDKGIVFTILQADNTTPQNISGWTMTFRMATDRYGSAVLTKTPSLTDATNGICTVLLASADTSSLTQDGEDTTYWYDLRRTDSGSRTELGIRLHHHSRHQHERLTMAYITAADFRTATLAEYCANLNLGTAEATDAQLTSAIDGLGQRLDRFTNDHFETESITIVLEGAGGAGSPRLVLPKRCTAVSSVSVVDSYGTATVQTSSVYRLHSSLYSSGSRRRGEIDFLELVYGAGGLAGYPFSQVDPYVWPADANSISMTGTFGWTTTPRDIKNALAIMVWDHFKLQRGDIRRATRWATTDVTVEVGDPNPTGIPEVDQIIEAFTRPEIPAAL